MYFCAAYKSIHRLQTKKFIELFIYLFNYEAFTKYETAFIYIQVKITQQHNYVENPKINLKI